MASISAFLRNLKCHPAFLAFLFVAILIFSLCIAFNPRWATNDDVAMSMIAHGYGLAAYGSPNLVSSNVLWGFLVRAIPSINGVLGYSLATLASLLVFGWATLYFLLLLGAGLLPGLLAISLLIAQPTLISQFTVNAGLLTAAAVIGWQVYARLGGIGNLVAACLFAFFGYLIRDKEFLLVLGVALPFLPWRALREQRQMQIAFLFLSVAIASAAAFDRWSYSGTEWQHFHEMNPIRASVIDFGASKYLKQRPSLITRYGYSQNDINLLQNWFFVDPQISDPKTVNAMLDELGPLPLQKGSIQSGFVAIKAFISPLLLPLFLSALLLFALMPRWSVAFVWLFCIGALFAIGVTGRPGVLRIYIPLLSLLLVAPLMFEKYREGARQWLTTLILITTCVGTAYMLITDSRISRQLSQQVQSDILGLPTGTIVSWAEDFPFELAFPVFASDISSHNIRLYGLDSFTFAPFSVARTEQTAGRGILERLRTATGIQIIASPRRLEMLSIYCREHLSGRLRGYTTYQTRSLAVQQVRCEPVE